MLHQLLTINDETLSVLKYFGSRFEGNAEKLQLWEEAGTPVLLCVSS